MPNENTIARLESLRLALEFFKNDTDVKYDEVTFVTHAFFKFIMPEKKDETA